MSDEADNLWTPPEVDGDFLDYNIDVYPYGRFSIKAPRVVSEPSESTVAQDQIIAESFRRRLGVPDGR